MSGKHTGNRVQRRRARKKSFFLVIVNTLLLLMLIMGGFYIWNSTQVPQTKNNQTKQTSQSVNTDTKKMEQSTSANNNDEIKWVKQEQPVQFPILMYHAIHVMDPSEAANAGLIVDPETFESHLKALKEAGYYTLTPEEAYKALTENVLPENKKVVWLTFDDSLRDFYNNAFPLLKKYEMKATNNVITGFVEIGREDILTLDEMKEMKKENMSFEDHTVNHPDLSVTDSGQVINELKDSKDFLDKNLSQETTTVAYPSGRYTDTTLQIAESLGYKMGLTTNNGLASLSNGLLSLNRVRVNPTTTAQDLLNEIATN